MNKQNISDLITLLKYKIKMISRLLEYPRCSQVFSSVKSEKKISCIYVINLDRHPQRWKRVKRELSRQRIDRKKSLQSITRRFSAVDSRFMTDDLNRKELIPYYSLEEQLKIDPEEGINEEILDRYKKIPMSRQEIAIVKSHLAVWKKVSEGTSDYVLILEDDVVFEKGFNKKLNEIWKEFENHKIELDFLLLSFDEIGDMPEKVGSLNSRIPTSGVWQASGYVISKKCVNKLMNSFPVKGPIDLWLNFQFKSINVRMSLQPLINQRLDLTSSNSYSIMPVLSQIGIYSYEKHKYYFSPKLKWPVIVMTSEEKRLNSFAMALSMLGYTCCNNIDMLPQKVKDDFVQGKKSIFNAYVNIGWINRLSVKEIRSIYPKAKIILWGKDGSIEINKQDQNLLYLDNDTYNLWEKISGFLRLEYPSLEYPNIPDSDIRKIAKETIVDYDQSKIQYMNSDVLPWIVSKDFQGIEIFEEEPQNTKQIFEWSPFDLINTEDWMSRSDTFPSNLSLFAPSQISLENNSKLRLSLHKECSSVREYKSGALTSNRKYVFGSFKTILKPSNCNGVITGVFLHRNSPHQEIDIEFLGNDTTTIMINVFYNPGGRGTRLEYGYRGTPVKIPLGFDASKDFHEYEINWQENFIEWKVDKRLIYKRVLWNPTPIPNLPLEFNVNVWCSRSPELSGNIDISALPTASEIGKIEIQTD